MNRQFLLNYRLRRWWLTKKYQWEARFVVRLAVWLRGVPVVAVTGTNGKTTTVHLIDRMLREAGYHVGTCTTYGVYHDGACVGAGDKAGHRGIWRALQCRGLQVIVAEVGRGGMLRHGTGFSQCRVGVVTNVFADHLGFDGVWTVDAMAAAKAEIIQRTDPAGAVVLNADDPRVAAMEQRTEARPVWFTIEGREHEFDRGWFLRDGALWRKDGVGEERLLAAIEMPMTRGGHQRYNIANALAALAAVEAMSDRFAVPRTAQCAVLREYERDPLAYPHGRFILTRFRGYYVLLLHLKNPDAYRAEAPFIRRVQAALGCRYLIGAATSIGNRLEEYHRAESEELARLCDGVFLRPPLDKYLRGLPAQELLRRLSVALEPGQLLGTDPLPAEVLLERARKLFGDSFILIYCRTHADPAFNLETFLREAEVLPLPAVALAGAA